MSAFWAWQIVGVGDLNGDGNAVWQIQRVEWIGRPPPTAHRISYSGTR
jgi:hypothetical protein